MSGMGSTCFCGGALRETRIRTRTFGLLRCATCGVFRIDPPPITRDEQSGDFYTAYYAMRQMGDPIAPPAPGRASRFWRVVRQVPALNAPQEKVIDFGSGEGGLCHELFGAGWPDVIGLDISRARVTRARQRFPGIRFYDVPLPQTDVPPGAADLCVMDNVIEHLTHPPDVLEELRRYLRPGGRIVVITPNMESGTFRFLGRRWTPELAPHAHIFLFTGASLRRLLVETGFVVETVGAFQEDPYPVREWLRRLFSGDVKGAFWRAHQELGAIYGRLIGSGPMLYAVAHAPGAQPHTAASPALPERTPLRSESAAC